MSPSFQKYLKRHNNPYSSAAKKQRTETFRIQNEAAQKRSAAEGAADQARPIANEKPELSVDLGAKKCKKYDKKDEGYHKPHHPTHRNNQKYVQCQQVIASKIER
jgi:hypothetical protein